METTITHLVVSTHLKNRSHWGSWSQNMARHKNTRNLIKAASWMSSLKPNYCSMSFRVPAWQCLEVPEAGADEIDRKMQDQNRIIQTLWFLMIFDELLILYIIIIYYLLLQSSFKRPEGSQYKKVTQLPQPAWPTRSSVIFDGRYPTESCGFSKTVSRQSPVSTCLYHRTDRSQNKP